MKTKKSLKIAKYTNPKTNKKRKQEQQQKNPLRIQNVNTFNLLFQ